MRTLVLGGVALVAVCLGAMKISIDRSEQRRVRADQITRELPKSTTDNRVVDRNVIAYSTQNEALLAARKKATDTLPRFLALKASGMKGTYTVKFPLTQNGKTEHIWLQVDDVRRTEFVGRLANEPVNGTKYRMGQTMTVAAVDVEDWMARTPDAIYGGYVARFSMKEMPKAQADRMATLFRD
jgi:uncharacterized protein YegJ (DUF2314 family)